ncbi:hypothetical protein THERU_03950 [Thermocrinis ruber]|uniref:Uncharacterized protein n=1 Tax=Thermocrinis ruber TaxID=75906 RepID=W0DDV6_9AQUI|nr:hypothetical protein [Thermocrinis ruber]AHE96799.1 hypothetical protein THERU_03950 [Thermocrinis ruber]
MGLEHSLKGTHQGGVESKAEVTIPHSGLGTVAMSKEFDFEQASPSHTVGLERKSLTLNKASEKQSSLHPTQWA